MLVLTRKYQEKIRIGNDITITVLRTKGKAVRLGIEAPATVPVIRGELKFDGDAAEARAAEVDELEIATAKGEPRQRDAAAKTAWTTKTRSRSARVAGPTAHVGHRRLPRENVSEIMPRLVTGTAPLRALLDQRSATV